jgi:hypothetical protein
MTDLDTSFARSFLAVTVGGDHRDHELGARRGGMTRAR